MVVLSLLASVGLAQTDDATPSADSVPQAPAKPTKKVELITATVLPDVRARDASRDGCDIVTDTKKLPALATVIVTRPVKCTPRYGTPKDYIEVLYDGKTFYVEKADIVLAPDRARELAQRSSDDIAEFVGDWQAVSKRTTLAAKKAVLDKLDRSATQGITIVDASIFDVSEYTEGTGFSVEVYNSSKKIIKYLTFQVIGLNAVKDPVRHRMTRQTTVTLRGIGPIAPAGTAAYRKDYMWFTDVVQYFNLVSVKVEWMDGSSRTIPRANLASLNRVERETLLDAD
jgi:hypothetical protein